MVHKKIRIPKDSAIDIMEELGKLDDCIQFEDLNVHDYTQKKNFGNLIERCEESIKNIQNFENILQLYGLKLIKYTSYQTFKIDLQTELDSINKNLNMNYFDLIEMEINENKKRITELIESYNNIAEQLDLLIEKKSVYDKSSNLIYFHSSNNNNDFKSDVNNKMLDNLNKTPGNIIFNSEKDINLLDEDSNSELNFISGVIKAEDDIKFKRMLFRVSRGRAIPSFFDLTIENRALQITKEKKIFIIFLQGGRSSFIFHKILSICDLFGASRFAIPQRDRLPREIFNLQQEIFDKKTYLKSVETSIKEFFKDKIGENGIPGKYHLYKLYFLQEKLLFITLNKCKLIGDFLDGEVWIPEEKYPLVQETLLKITKKDQNKLTAVLNDIIYDNNNKNPPTYFKLNDFSAPFQKIVNEYGIPRYREVNPGLFTIITFPFIFGVMFGDIGHGALLTLLGAWLVIKKYEILKNFPDLKILVQNRYFFLFLGFFAFYNGLIYDDFFALPLGIFGSCYKNQKKNSKIVVVKENNCVYPIGLDPKWYSSSNELSFLNSFKMKMSVIIGVLQMILGLILKGINGIYFGEYVEFLFEFIPQLIFMCLLFGYMILMIYIKWGIDWSDDPSKAPSIISQLLMLFLNMGSTGPDNYKTPLFHREDYTYQETFQYYALIISIICIPIMLLVKPLCEYFKLKKKNINIGEIEHNENNKNNVTMTDLAVNQIIETIEYVLGTVSHTASYLRLWALSLAHAQLSKVFFDITLLGSIQSGNIFGMLFGFFLLSNITLGVLMGMDFLECVLHTLRLHWVEFQSKFYHADGIPFTPFSFKYINDEFL